MRPGRRVPPLPVLVLWAVMCGGTAAVGQGLTPYTVQVAALSDSEGAIDLSGSLLRDGFPAYVVRAEGAARTT